MFLLSYLAGCVQKFAGEAVSLVDASVALVSKILAVDFYVVSSVLAETGRLGLAFLDGLWTLGLFLHHTVQDFASFVWDLVDVTHHCLLFGHATLSHIFSLLLACYLAVTTTLSGILTLVQVCGLAIWFLFLAIFQHVRSAVLLVARALDLALNLLVYLLALIPPAILSVLLAPVTLTDIVVRHFIELCRSMLSDGRRLAGVVVGSVLAVPVDAYVGFVVAVSAIYLSRRYSLHRSLASLIDERCCLVLARVHVLCRTGLLTAGRLNAAMAATGKRLHRATRMVVSSILLKLNWIFVQLGYVIVMLVYRLRWSVRNFRDRFQRRPVRNDPAAGVVPESSSSETEEDDVLERNTGDGVSAKAKSLAESCARNKALLIKQLQERLAQAQENSLCIVCQDRDKSIVLLPCRHFCMCQGCAYRVWGAAGDALCPVCRRDIDDLMPVFS